MFAIFYMYSLRIHNIHIQTAIETDSRTKYFTHKHLPWIMCTEWLAAIETDSGTKYFTDKHLPWIMCTEWLTACHMCFLNTLWAAVFSIIFFIFLILNAGIQLCFMAQSSDSSFVFTSFYEFKIILF